MRYVGAASRRHVGSAGERGLRMFRDRLRGRRRVRHGTGLAAAVFAAALTATLMAPGFPLAGFRTQAWSVLTAQGAYDDRLFAPVGAARPAPSTCRQRRAAGVPPSRLGAPGYRPELDADADGWACEPLPKRDGGGVR